MKDDLHVLIVGQPRGGTSLLYNMMCAAYPEFGHAPGEAAAVQELKLPGPRVSKRPLDSARQDETVHAAAKHKRDLRVIAVIRDPRDVLTSVHLKGGYAGDGVRYKDRAGNVGEALGFRTIHYGLMGWLDALVVRYEHLVLLPEVEQKRVATHIGVEPTGIPYQDFHKAGAALPMKAGHRNRPLTAEFLERWKKPQHREQVLKVFGGSKQLRAAVMELGYEADDTWLERLRGETAK
jgi:hypothetical protein